jgi:hypothetical protein
MRLSCFSESCLVVIHFFRPDSVHASWAGKTGNDSSRGGSSER